MLTLYITTFPFVEQTGISLTGISYNSNTSWGDYNNDGDLDILITGHGGSSLIAKIYKNNGNNNFTEQTAITLAGAYSGSAVLGDYDNDGFTFGSYKIYRGTDSLNMQFLTQIQSILTSFTDQ